MRAQIADISNLDDALAVERADGATDHELARAFVQAARTAV